MKRCEECGRFFDGEHCPGEHAPLEVGHPPPPPSRAGEWTTYELDGTEYPAMFVSDDRVCVYGPGENGHVGVYTVREPDER